MSGISSFFHGRRYHIILLVGVALVFIPMFYVQLYLKKSFQTDFFAHIYYAAKIMNNSGEIPGFMSAHMGWQYLVLFAGGIGGSSLLTAGFFVTLLCEAFAALVLFRLLSPLIQENRLHPMKGVAFVLGLMTVAPISFLWPFDRLMYLGYLSATSYHNPSIILLRPFAVIQFGMACALFGKTRFTGRQIGAAALISLLATFAKPSFAICFLPALGLLALYRLIRKQDLDFRGLFLGIFIPIISVLAWQFIIAYLMDAEAGIAFLPFAVMNFYSSHLALKFLASILFPALVGILYFKRALSDLRMVLSWMIFSFGAAYTYLLAETGDRLSHGNFGWSAEIAIFILFVASIVFYLEAPKTSRWKTVAIQFALGLHVLFGIAYYFYCMFNNIYY